MIEKFAGYGFNKSHSTAYALIAYMTAYLKAHYPVEFMAALLSGDIPGRNFKSKDALVEHLEDCKRMEIAVVPPDVSRSFVDFAVRGDGADRDGKILFGLSAIKACGGGAADAIVAEREKNGPFSDLFDFCERVDPQQCNRATIETLVKSGAFDSFGSDRAPLMAGIDRAMQSGASVLADKRSGQKGLFDDVDEPDEQSGADLPEVPEFEEKEKLSMEKEVLGFYLSSHPLAEYESVLRTYCTHSSKTLGNLEHRTEIVVGGMLAAIKFSHTKNPKPGAPSKYAMWDLEDLDGITRCILWPEQFAQFGSLVEADAIVGLRAAVDRRPGAEEVNLIINEVFPIAEMQTRFTSGVTLVVDEQKHGEEGLKKLREILRMYDGDKPLRLQLLLADGGGVTLDSQRRVRLDDPELRRRVEELLGAGCYRLNSAPPKASAPANGRGRRRAATVGG